ncbi:methyltransferase-like protein 17, mitochondrial isoform X2 [Belonocnema kinseyi]|uniref:methyltransferase-like protein 17, mitochondrial isoform X2 n=1 Tax=Belonocnema kinseyi TaxID=2817044 RepID=UPI00143E0109|nr:methyltransferase-like protein 17, mitochondrial isoform X2 [Belonocnema kinseyi]
MLLKTRFALCQLRWFSSKVTIKLNESFNALLESSEARHRKHPGIVARNVIHLPKHILKAMDIVLEDVPNKPSILEECVQFKNHLHGRHIPVEENESREKYETIQQHLMRNIRIDNLSDAEIEALAKKSRPKALKMLKKYTNMWKAINFDAHRSLLYMIARSSQDYAVLYSIFDEIRTRDKNFKPETVLDFGSGIGTTMWATNEQWPNIIKEYMNVDISLDISNLSETIMKIAHPNFNGIFYRQFMPMSLRPNYDIVVSAYSLIELPNAKTRLDAVMKLWNKTKSYLVIVENGNNAGFNLVNEARDFVLLLSNSSSEADNKDVTHAFAPCPHDLACPRLSADNTPCNFEVGYTSSPLIGNVTTQSERYSYVVLKKGTRSETDGDWPRLVRPTLKRGKHAFCRMCCSSGNLEEIIFTRSKHGRNLYRCARVSRWGDRLPVVKNIESNATIENESSSGDKEESEGSSKKE